MKNKMAKPSMWEKESLQFLAEQIAIDMPVGDEMIFESKELKAIRNELVNSVMDAVNKALRKIEAVR